MTSQTSDSSGPAEHDRCVNYIGSRTEHAHRTIGDIMVRHPKSAPVDATVGIIREKLTNPNLRNVVLLDGSAFAGLVERGAIPDDAAPSDPARQFALTDVPTTTADTPVPHALATMDAAQLQRLVVLDGDGQTLAGLVCIDPTGEGFCSD